MQEQKNAMVTPRETERHRGNPGVALSAAELPFMLL